MTRIVLLAFLLLGAGTGADAMAQQTAPAAPNAAVANPDAGKIAAFSDAYIRAAGVIQRWEPKVAAAPDADKDALVDQASGEIASAIEQGGAITLAEYRDIIVAAEADPALASRIQSSISERAPR